LIHSPWLIKREKKAVICNDFSFETTLYVPLGVFINETSIISVGSRLAVNNAIINDVEQTNVVK